MNADELRKMISMVDVVKSHGAFASGNDPEEIAIEWDEWDFSLEEVDAWLYARCFEPEMAYELKDCDITPEQAGKMTERGIGGYKDTIGYKLSNCDLTLEEAIEEVEAM